MEMKIPMIAISAFVVIVIMAGVLIPVVDDYRDTTVEKYNTTNGIMSKLSNESETIIYDAVNKTATINDVVVASGNSRVFCISDQFVLQSGDTLLWNDYEQVGVTATGDVTIDIVDGKTVTITDSADAPVSKTYEVGWCFVASPDGDYRAIPNGTSTFITYLNSIDQIYGSNWLGTTSKWFSFEGSKVTYDGTTIDADYTLTPVTGVNDVYTAVLGGGAAGEYSFVVDNSGSDYTCHPRFWIVPASVEGVKEGKEAINSLLGVIPVMVVIALLVAVVALVFRGRNF